MAFVNFKINNKVMNDILNGRTAGNTLIPKLEKLGQGIADQAKANTYTARNNSDGRRRVSWRSGEAGREETGRLAHSFHVQTNRSASGAPEVRVGSYVPYFKYHEMGTNKIIAGNMLKDAMQSQTGRNVSGFMSGMPSKL